MDTRKLEIERFDQALAAIERQFPSLRIMVDRDHPHVEAMAEIPAQKGLDFDVSINLQNRDELHLNVSHFWVEWFPCGDEEVFKRFVEAVTGLLAGRYRIIESYVFGRAIKARLQRPKDGSWETIATWSNLGTLIPWKRTERVINNMAAT